MNRNLFSWTYTYSIDKAAANNEWINNSFTSKEQQHLHYRRVKVKLKLLIHLCSKRRRKNQIITLRERRVKGLRSFTYRAQEESD